VAFVEQDTAGVDFVSSLPADGSTRRSDTLFHHEAEVYEVVFSGDGRAALRLGSTDSGDANVAWAPSDGSGEPEMILDSEFNEANLSLSPDGRWLAYVSDVSGRMEVYVRPFPGPGPRVQVSRDGASYPRWAHSGDELFYRALDGWMRVAQVTTEPTFAVQTTERLFDSRPFRVGVNAYDLSLDDQLFLMIGFLSGDDQQVPTGTVVFSEGWYWSDEVRAQLGERR
jgi:hypothetical protein